MFLVRVHSSRPLERLCPGTLKLKSKNGASFGQICGQEITKDELARLKGQRADLRKAMRDNRKAAKNAAKRKKRLVKAVYVMFAHSIEISVESIVFMLKVNPKLQYFLHAQAAKMLSAADLKLLVEAKSSG